MSRTRNKKFWTQKRIKSGKLSFPRGNKNFNGLFLDEENEIGSVKISPKKIYQVTGRNEYDQRSYVDTHKMRRDLRKQVGRPWDEVQKEFLKGHDARTLSGYKIRKYLEFAVEQNAIIQKDGKITNTQGVSLGCCQDKLYVYPFIGLLQMIPGDRSQCYKRTPRPQTVFEMDGTYYHEHEGLWYRAEMRVLEKKKNWWSIPRDAFVSLEFESHWLETYVFSVKYGRDPKGRLWHCVKKESANSKEIARVKSKYNLVGSNNFHVILADEGLPCKV